jgi:hypothetical protein
MRHRHYPVISFLALMLLLAVVTVGVDAAVPAGGTRVVVVSAPESSCRVSILGPSRVLETLEVSGTREFAFPATAQLGVLVQVVGSAADAELKIEVVPSDVSRGGQHSVSAKGSSLVGSVAGGEARAFTIGRDKEPPRRAT